MHNHAHRPPNSQSQGELNTVLDRISIRLNQSDEANPVTVRTSLTTDGGTAALNSNGAASNDSSFRGMVHPFVLHTAILTSDFSQVQCKFCVSLVVFGQ